MEVLLLELGPELLVEVVDREGAVDTKRFSSIRSMDSSGRSNSSSMSPTISSRTSSSVTIPSVVAVLVDHDGHVLLLAPEVREERGEILRLRNDVCRANDRLEANGRDAEVVDRGEEIAHVQDPDDLVERLAVHGVARERRVDDGA